MRSGAAWAALAALLAARPAGAAFDKDVQACPDGSYPIATNNPDEPFHCKTELRTDQPFIQMTPNFKLQTCPKGSHPVATPGLGGGARYRCVMNKEASDEPRAAPLLPGQSGGAHASKAAAVPTIALQYEKLTLQGAFQAEVPRGWHTTDGWEDATPGYYLEYDTGRQGRQVQIVISKAERSQEDYVDLPTAVARDLEWQNAAEGKPGRVAGLPARFTYIRKSARTAYIAAGDDAYFVVSFTAPEDLYQAFEPAYLRLLSTLRLAKDQRR